MAITRLNSLAIPVGTVEPADISYPLTNFSSTGIDDNATSTAITIDASENVGIGTNAPSELLDVGDHTTAGNRNIRISQRTGLAETTYGGIEFFYDNTAGTTGVNAAIKYAAGPLRNDGELTFHTGASGSTSERLRIDHNGNVGIGTSSPSTKMEISTNSETSVLRLTDKATIGSVNRKVGGVEFYQNDASGGAGIGSSIEAYHVNISGHTDLRFATGDNTERMRIDSSGNLLVGKDSTDNTTNGFVLDANGTLNVVRSSEYLMRLNRTTTDGEILRFQKDGTQVGSIQSISGVVSGIVLDPRNVNSGGAGIAGTNGNAIVPMDRLGVSDADIDLGLSSIRWRNLYLSGGAYLGGTGSANHLDDYEEGNWSPTITGSSGASGQSYSHQRGRYRKIGNVVHITFDAELTNAGSISGTYMVLGGLPFSGDGANVGGGIVTTYSSGWSSNLVEPILAYISGSLCYLMEGGSTGNDYILQSNNYHSSSSRLIGWGTVILPA